VERLQGQYPVRRLCRTLGVHRSGYHRWLRQGQTRRDREDRRLKQSILEVHAETRGCYGTPRIERALRHRDIRTSRRRVARLRRELGLCAKGRRRFRTTTDSKHSHPVAPNRLERRFEAPAADRIWVGDITYLWTQEGWLYLAIVLDTFSRRIVGWSLHESLERELATSALQKALEGRRPGPGLLHHTDRGSQYASVDYREILEAADVVFSMSRKGNCWDNAMAESFFKTLKSELGRSFDSREQARREVFGYIEGFYNTWRLHSSLGYKSPAQYEREHRSDWLDLEAA
jgi:transposase InsO family protein